MRWIARLQALPVRGKLLLTVLGAAVAALGASTYLSFRYWEHEALSAAERQALLAASSTAATVESALRMGRPDPARHSLDQLRQEGTITSARVYGPRGEILLSADRYEEGRRAASVWIPDPSELPRTGLVKVSDDGRSVQSFLPLSLPEPAVLEVTFSVAATKTAMERGARLGIGLMAGSLLAVIIIIVTMFEHEVVGPLQRIDVLLRSEHGRGLPPANRDELSYLERSVSRLIEQEKQVQARVDAQAGLAQVGELAAEMAHEFKRPLASIRTAVDVLQQEYELDEGGKSVLSAVDGQLERLYDTMQDLFSLAKPVVLQEGSVDVADTLDEALMELAGLLDLHAIETQRAFGHQGLQVSGDRRRLSQALLNVLTNAVEAMPEGGRLTVSMSPVEPGSVEVSITDTGGGLDPEAVERALKPFYSTKPAGTGLGLPLVARIVAAHGGGLAIESRPHVGTTVRITLPLVSESRPEES
jgi:signal transduction histidine kinase